MLEVNDPKKDWDLHFYIVTVVEFLFQKCILNGEQIA